MTLTTLLISAFLMGIFGSGHCLGMCGGIASLAGYTTSSEKSALNNSVRILLFNSGRISSYVAIAILLSTLLKSMASIDGLHWLGNAFQILAAFLLILTGLHLAGWLKVLDFIERKGQPIWKAIMPFAQKFIPITHYHHAFFLGIFWGWLPCGLLYSALSFSALAPTPLQSGLAMLCFGLGTLPSMFSIAQISSVLKNWLQKKIVRMLLGSSFLGMGSWTIYRILSLI